MRNSVFAVVLFAVGLILNAVGAEKPNVLILFTDDQRADTIHALGNDDIYTPNLDALARRGCHVSSAYCLGSNMGAVCRPSRNMLLSGRTYFRWAQPQSGQPQRNAPALPNTLPATFGSHGYETYHHGKRGNTAELIHRQFDHSHYLNDFADRWSMEAGKKIVDDAIQFLGNRTGNASPWLMYLAFATPHDPRAASPQARARYVASTLTLPPSAAEAHRYNNGSVLGRDEWTAVWPRTSQVLRDQLHDYYATITTIDENIGRLIAELKAWKQYDNTLIVFTSDHGLSMGGHGLMGKQNVYEHGYKAPMVIAGPGVKQGTADAPIYLMDLFPTLCELADIPIPPGLDGKSFAGMVTTDGPGPHDAIMLSYTDSQRAIRVREWKLICYPQINRTQLFNLRQDPDELKDLANDPAQADRIDMLLDRMRALQAAQGDVLPLTRSDPLPAEFLPPRPSTAAPMAPRLTTEGDQAGLRSTAVVGGQGASSGTPFTVRRPDGGFFTAIAIGYSRNKPRVVTGIRFDIVAIGQRDDQRQTVIAGDPHARWGPLLDQMKPHRQPIGIHGGADNVIRRLGIIQGDGKTMPPWGGEGGASFEVRIPGTGNPRTMARVFRGFHGTIQQNDQGATIESLGLLYEPLP